MIKWEEDYQEKHKDNKLPVLDVKMFKDVTDKKEVIKYDFYQKEVSDKRVMSAHSAMPVRMKYSALVEELGRRFRNTSPSLVDVREKSLVEEFNLRMAQSDHSQEFRLKVTSDALTKYLGIQDMQKHLSMTSQELTTLTRSKRLMSSVL